MKKSVLLKTQISPLQLSCLHFVVLMKTFEVEDEYYYYCHFTFQHREAWGDKGGW